MRPKCPMHHCRGKPYASHLRMGAGFPSTLRSNRQLWTSTTPCAQASGHHAPLQIWRRWSGTQHWLPHRRITPANAFGLMIQTTELKAGGKTLQCHIQAWAIKYQQVDSQDLYRHGMTKWKIRNGQQMAQEPFPRYIPTHKLNASLTITRRENV